MYTSWSRPVGSPAVGARGKWKARQNLAGGAYPSRVRGQQRANPHRPRALLGGAVHHLVLADFDVLESISSVLGVNQEVAVLASAFFALVSVMVNLWGGLYTEKARAELQLEAERSREAQRQMSEIASMIARYRGPLLEAAIDLEQKLWHLMTDKCLDQRGASLANSPQELRYVLFTIAQFLGFVEVLRREGPRQAHFLQLGSPEGNDTLSTLVEGIRFVLGTSPAYLQRWYDEGQQRQHPGAWGRPSRTEVISRLQLRQQGEAGGEVVADEPMTEGDLLCILRGHQRAIGTYMISTEMGAERHYTISYGEFHTRLEADPEFKYWFLGLESDVAALAKGAPWTGEQPFPHGRWTRVLLLQQLLVELIDLLDPDCVRLPLGRRVRLMPVPWASLPGLQEYRCRLEELNAIADPKQPRAEALKGLEDLAWPWRGYDVGSSGEWDIQAGWSSSREVKGAGDGSREQQ